MVLGRLTRARLVIGADTLGAAATVGEVAMDGMVGVSLPIAVTTIIGISSTMSVAGAVEGTTTGAEISSRREAICRIALEALF